MRKDLFTELIPTQYYQHIIENSIQKKNFFVLDKQKKLSNREKLLKVCDTSLNQRHADGRIYHLDKEGRYSSHSVSPHSKNFEENIEKGIKDLVLAFNSKNYFTISSCQSHGIYYRRYVSIVFPSKEIADNFTKLLPFELTYFVEHATDVLNSKLETDDHGNILSIEKVETSTSSKEDAIEYISCFVRRPYSDAWIVEVLIYPAIKPESNFFSHIKAYIYRTFFLDRFTKKITDFIRSDKFEPNLY